VELNENVVRLIEKYSPGALGIAPLYAVYKPLFDAEVSVLDIIRKSEYTSEIEEQDSRRDHIFRGLADAVKSSLNHFNAAKQEAARKLNVVFEHYGNIAAKSSDQETAAIDDLLRELASGTYPALISALALNDWTVQLNAENQQYKVLMAERYTESSHRPATNMKIARTATDKALRNIFNQIEALTLVNGIAAYEAFIREMNAVLERYKNILAQEKGRRTSPNPSKGGGE
jgi:hypothetical protein